MAAQVQLTAALVESFAGVYLSPMYDNPVPTPAFHREAWELYCSPQLLTSVVAPREHAKSTALTHDMVLAELCFRVESYFVIVSATEDLAKDHLGDIAKVLRENDEVRAAFLIQDLEVDAKTEIVVRFTDGTKARILGKGSGQKMRGLKWFGRRPGRIYCDDLEDDEQVDSLDRRIKFRRWFNRALLPAGRRGCKVRVHGTILHEDSLLSRIHKRNGKKKNAEAGEEQKKTWGTLFFKAHRSFGEFVDILWPEQFPEERLRAIRQRFIDDQDSAGYSQEYLNNPLDSDEAYLREPYFIPMGEKDHRKPKLIGAAADFAISKADKANRTSLTVGGKCVDNLLHFVDQTVGRMDSEEIIEAMFAVQKKWHPDVFWVESGQIWLALKATVQKEMQKKGIWINFVERTPIKDKAARGRSLQKRMKGNGTRWDTEAEWFEEMKDEMLRFTGYAEATLDDQFDSAALLSLGFEDLAEVEEEDFTSEEELEMRRADPRASSGRSKVTGY
jgi:predicted phage terminase large subunit-like protein